MIWRCPKALEHKFEGETYFNSSTFEGETYFNSSTFEGETYFNSSIFEGETNFSSSIFKGGIYFSSSIFEGETYFNSSTFEGETYFNSSIFEGETYFSLAYFKGNVDFKDTKVTEILILSGTTWEKRLDLRGMRVRNLQWDSTKNPSDVKGVFDFRGALVGSAVFKEVKFQDLVKFSRTTFNLYLFDILELKTADFMNFFSTDIFVPSAKVWLENNTFEKEVDLLHANFNCSALLISNRFLSTLDLTGVTFNTQNSGISSSQENQPHLCLSFNRIQRLVFEPKHLGNLPGFDPRRQIPTLIASLMRSWKPLEESTIREAVQTECAPISKNTNNSDKSESLSDLYETLETSFRAANDQGGINETFYLQQVAKPPIGDLPSWLLLDLPSRYAVDVWRTVWVSIIILRIDILSP